MFFINILQKKALSDISAEREVKFMPIKDVKNVCFVFDVGEESVSEAVKYLADYLNEKQIQYSGFAIDLKQNKHSGFFLDFKTQTITKKDLSFIGTPNAQVIDKISKMNPDLYIDFCQNKNYTHDFIVRSSKATFKVGRFDNDDHPFDLVIGSNKPGYSPLDYIKQVIHHLTSIKSAK